MVRYILCFNCGRVTSERTFCLFCHSPIMGQGGTFPPSSPDGIYLGDTEDGKPFYLPVESLKYHLAFYGVTGAGKTRAAMNLAIGAENRGINLRVVDIEGEWKRIIPRLKKETLYFDAGDNLQVNLFDLDDVGMTLMLLKETIFLRVEQEYKELTPQMNYVLGECVRQSRSIPELLDRVIYYNPQVPFPFNNLNATKTALLTRLSPFKDNPVLRRIFYVEKSTFDPKAIEGKNLVIDLHDLDRRVAYKQEVRLLYNAITAMYLQEALGRPEQDQVRNLFIADEAQLLVPTIFHKAVATDTWMTTDFATRLRKRGESLCVITQAPSNIEADIRKNAQNVFIFRIQDPEDIKAVAGMLGSVQVDEVNYWASRLSRLEGRNAVVKTPSAGSPCVLRTAEVRE